MPRPDDDDLDVDLRRLRRSAVLAGIGDGLAAVALPLLATRLTRDPLSLAGVVAAQHAPWVLVALLRPLVLAPLDRRTSVGLADSLRAVAVGILGLRTLVGVDSLLLVLVTAAAVGLGSALTDDVERAASADAPPSAAASPSTRLAVAGMVGVALIGLPAAGFLYEVLVPVPLFLDVLPFTLAALFALAVRRPVTSAVPRAPTRPRLTPGTGPVVGVAALATAASSAVVGVLVLFALDELGFGAPAFGLLLTGMAASAALGGALAPFVATRLRLRPTLAIALVLTGAGHVGASLLADRETPLPAALCLAGAALAGMVATVAVRALLHTAAVDGVDERGTSAFHLAVWAAVPVGALLGGWAAKELGVLELVRATAGASALAAIGVAAIRPSRSARKDLTAPGSAWSDPGAQELDEARGGGPVDA